MDSVVQFALQLQLFETFPLSLREYRGDPLVGFVLKVCELLNNLRAELVGLFVTELFCFVAFRCLPLPSVAFRCLPLPL